MAELLRPSQAASTLGRRRTVTRSLAASTPSRHKAVLTSGGVKAAEGSDAPETSRPLHFKLENSYRMKPQDEERFQAWKVEEVMGEVLKERLEGVTYDPDTCQDLAKDLASHVQRRVKDFRWQRYRVVCHVTIGQQCQQGLRVCSRCVWDHHVDSHASVTFHNKSLFAVAQCYGVYFE
ncbi:dynein light chain Tctex-type protein 2B-like isoform X2 [Babylonia areolata]